MPYIQVNVYTETDKDEDTLADIIEKALVSAGIDVHDIELFEVSI